MHNCRRIRRMNHVHRNVTRRANIAAVNFGSLPAQVARSSFQKRPENSSIMVVIISVIIIPVLFKDACYEKQQDRLCRKNLSCIILVLIWRTTFTTLSLFMCLYNVCWRKSPILKIWTYDLLCSYLFWFDLHLPVLHVGSGWILIVQMQQYDLKQFKTISRLQNALGKALYK